MEAGGVDTAVERPHLGEARVPINEPVKYLTTIILPNYYYERKGGGSVALFSARAPGGTDESACTCGFTCLGYSVIILMFAQ